MDFLDGGKKEQTSQNNGGNAGGNDNTGGSEFKPEWLKGVDETLLNEPSVRIMKDLNSLVKSYVSAQKAIGADKVVVPGKNATPEQWSEFYKKVGVPESEDKYGLQRDEKSPVDEAFFGEFKKAAFSSGLLPHQAQALLGTFENMAKGNTEKFAAQVKEESERQVAALRNEWGEAFDSKLETIKETVDRFGGDELRAVLKQAGLGTHPAIAKLFVQIGESLKEKAPKGLEPKTPMEVKKSIEEIMSDRAHPYHNADHIGHAAAVKEVEALFQKQFSK